MAVSAASAMSLMRSFSSLDLAADARAARARRSALRRRAQPSNKEGLEDPTLETPLKDTGLPTSPPAPPIDGRTLFDLEVEEEDNEIARRSIVERLFKNVSWGTVGEDARANLYYYALDHGLLAQTLEGQERQGTASGKDGPLHGLKPGRMSHGSSDEELVCDHCRREIREDQDSLVPRAKVRIYSSQELRSATHARTSLQFNNPARVCIALPD